jgi:hypothetical protein
MIIATNRIAEEGIDADVTLAGPEGVGDVAVGDVRRSINLVAFICCAIGPENVVDKISRGATI